ncbi:MAG: hypothetical protein JRG81_07705 [Deltaproteobacteria bacterium]|nr:hypothetical protein [Deltaproteobacteria bacterium]
MNIKKRFLTLLLISLVIHAGCFKGIKVNDINEKPVPIETMLSNALSDLGLMTEIYGSSSLKIQSAPLVDRTGPEWKKGGEISRSFTEKIKSAVSSIGGRVKFIPYDPVFAHVQMVKYETDIEKRLFPDVVIEGEIINFNPGEKEKGGKGCSARIAFDFIDFHTLASIPRVRTENDVQVNKGKKRNTLGIMLSGSLYQKEGAIEKTNGGGDRATRMLVELSVIQLIGKHLAIPYWRLLDGAEADPIVFDAIKWTYYKMDEREKISKVQELLFLHGYDVTPSGTMNMETKIALQDYENTQTLFHRPVDQNLFFKLYLSLPITDETLEKRFYLDRMLNPS